MTTTRASGRGLAFLVLGLMLLSGSRPLAAQNAGTIRGTVRNVDDDTPVSGAQVSIPVLGVGVVTNRDGRYELTNVPAGSHEVSVEIIGFAPETRQGVAVAPVRSWLWISSCARRC